MSGRRMGWGWDGGIFAGTTIQKYYLIQIIQLFSLLLLLYTPPSSATSFIAVNFAPSLQLGVALIEVDYHSRMKMETWGILRWKMRKFAKKNFFSLNYNSTFSIFHHLLKLPSLWESSAVHVKMQIFFFVFAISMICIVNWKIKE